MRAGSSRHTVWRDWAVERKIPESPDVMTFVFKRIDDRLVKTSLPGQYVTVQTPMPDGVRQPRQFSLTRADDGQHRQISIKRVRGGGRPDGEVSTLMCDTLQVGDVVTMSLPYGDVVLDDSGRPVVFDGAGIGITPMAGMLSHLVAAGSGPADHAAARRRGRGPFALRRQVVSDVLALRMPRSTSGTRTAPAAHEPVDGVHSGLMDLDRRQLCPTTPGTTCAARSVHAGGAKALIERGVAPRDIQYEVFGPDLWQADLD